MQEIVLNSGVQQGKRDGICRDDFLVFKLAGREYGISVQQVKAFRGYDSITSIADAPDYIKKLVDTCDVLVPVIDPRIKFTLDAPKHDMFTAVLVLRIGGRVMGMVVDSVSDVIGATREQIRPVPQTASAFESAFATGVVAVDQRVVTLIDIDALVSGPDMSMVGALEE